MKIISQLQLTNGLDIDRQVRDLLAKYNYTSATIGYHGYQHACCVSPNRVAVHGVPNERQFKDGDIVSIDVAYRDENGIIFDECETFIIGETSIKRRRLVEVAKKALEIGIRACIVGAKVSDIGNAIQEYIDTTPFSIMKEFVGHSVDHRLHGDIVVKHFKNSDDYILREGDRICIEPIIVAAKMYKIKTLIDNWTILCDVDCAQFERTIQL